MKGLLGSWGQSEPGTRAAALLPGLLGAKRHGRKRRAGWPRYFKRAISWQRLIAHDNQNKRNQGWDVPSAQVEEGRWGGVRSVA